MNARMKHVAETGHASTIDGRPVRTPGPSTSITVWLALMGYLVLAKMLLSAFFPTAFADPAQAALFAWPMLAVIGVLGLAGVWLAQKTGLPDAWDSRISNRSRLLIPLAVGLVWGMVPVIIDLATGFTGFSTTRRGIERQWTGYVPMLLIFTAASPIVEVLYRLLPIPLLLWLTSLVGVKERGQERAFWALALATSAIEPLSLLADTGGLAGAWLVVFVANTFGFNLAQAASFRRYGFLAAIVLRVGFYVTWHVLYIH